MIRSGATSKNTPNRRSRTSVTAWDVGLLALLVLLSVLSFITVHHARSGAAYVWISANGRPLGFYPLTEEREIYARGPIGVTVIRIHKGQVSITKAPCAHKFCQKMGPIPAHGNVMICIPNRIIVEIRGKKGRGPDAITR